MDQSTNAMRLSGRKSIFPAFLGLVIAAAILTAALWWLFDRNAPAADGQNGQVPTEQPQQAQ